MLTPLLVEQGGFKEESDFIEKHTKTLNFVSCCTNTSCRGVPPYLLISEPARLDLTRWLVGPRSGWESGVDP